MNYDDIKKLQEDIDGLLAKQVNIEPELSQKLTVDSSVILGQNTRTLIWQRGSTQKGAYCKISCVSNSDHKAIYFLIDTPNNSYLFLSFKDVTDVFLCIDSMLANNEIF